MKILFIMAIALPGLLSGTLADTLKEGRLLTISQSVSEKSLATRSLLKIQNAPFVEACKAEMPCRRGGG